MYVSVFNSGFEADSISSMSIKYFPAKDKRPEQRLAVFIVVIFVLFSRAQRCEDMEMSEGENYRHLTR